MRTILLPSAIADLEGIGDYIARDNPRRAASYVADLRHQCVKIAGNPAGYRLRPEVAERMEFARAPTAITSSSSRLMQKRC